MDSEDLTATLEQVVDDLHPLSATDPLLAIFVGMVNDMEGSMGLTLTVGGTIVTGNLIGGKEYHERLGAELEKFGEFGKGMAQGLRPGTEGRYGREAFEARGEDELPPATWFIHMADARHLVGGVFVPTDRGALWRGKLAAVEGWHFGVLNQG